MKDSDREHIKRWVESWKRAEPALFEVHRQELHTCDYEKNHKMVDELLQWAFEHRQERLTSGLVEQQRLFIKIKQNK